MTGGTSGIGLGIAEQVLSEGASAVVVCSVDKNIEEVVFELKKKKLIDSQKVEGLYCDVSIKEDRMKLVKLVEREFGRIDVLYVNAGIALF